MDALKDLVAKLKYLQSDGKYDLLIDSLNDNRTMIEDLNLAQLQEGMKADGEMLPNYSPVSVAVYGKPAGAIKLYDTGAFYRGFDIDNIDRDGFVIWSRDSKAGKLIEKYGIDIFGLTPESEEEAGQIMLPSLIEYLKEYLEI